jgi:hypothetical protein
VRWGGAVQPAPLLPVIEPHPIIVLAGGATNPVAFTRHYAPNLAVSTEDIARLRIEQLYFARPTPPTEDELFGELESLILTRTDHDLLENLRAKLGL